MGELSASVRTLHGFGETRCKSLAKLNILTLGDLISYLPRRYQDRSICPSITALTAGEEQAVVAMVAAKPTLQRIRKGMEIVRFRAVDASGSLQITYFNQPYMQRNFTPGESYVFFGRVEGEAYRREMLNPVAEKEGVRFLTGGIVPVYPTVRGVSQTMLLKAIREGLDGCIHELSETLPEELRQAHQLCHVRYAYENIHFPSSFEELAIARRRIVFEELFDLTLALRLMRSERSRAAVPPCREIDLAPFYEALPFALTGAQRRAIEDCLRDMQSGSAMSRLCQGDVGSGKTMVAAALIWYAAQNGLQSALMAPTEVLARQHYNTLAPLMERFSLRTALLTGSSGAKERREILTALKAGEIDLLIGTHALISEGVEYQKLGLVVTDEQHRFGVAQRAALTAKGEHPHMLVMSATPIPRTLALIIYGDLDVSVLDELPPGREKVDTFFVPSSYRKRIYAFLRKQIEEGRQAYIVCSKVEEGEDEIGDERKAVAEYADKLQKEIFPDLRIALIHGRMKPKEKESVMAAYAAGEIDILVSTTVIEVGVDVPNASVMVVEDAERFGLSQLHQLRGRVGRGRHKSYCILISDSKGEEARERLGAMTKTNDGFKIAEEDLRLRGPGDFFGARQHGLPPMKAADLSCDMALLTEAQAAAITLLENDPGLGAHPVLLEKIKQLLNTNADILN